MATDTPRSTDRYRLFGSVGSPYALKLRAIMRYQRLPFDWVPASLDWVPEDLDRPMLSEAARGEIAHIRPPVIPVVYFPSDGTYRNDSTFVAYALDRESGSRPVVPPDPGAAFLSHLLEDMADEWGVKIAFHYRWGRAADRMFKSRIVVGELMGGGFGSATQISAAKRFADRQVSRMPLVGCTPGNAPLILETFRRILEITGKLQETSTFLFGPRPSLADFGWYGQLVSLATDPTSRSVMARDAPGTFSYLQLLDDASGIDADWSEPGPLSPAVRHFLMLAGEVYLPFLTANEAAFEAGQQSFSFSALGQVYSQNTFKYQVKCLQWLQEEFAALSGEPRERTEAALRETGCLEALQSGWESWSE